MSELNVYHHELRHNEYDEFYLKYEADKVIAEKDKEIAELKAKLGAVNELIKTARQMLDDAKATHYAESVDAGMENRRLKRALWIARAKRAFDCKEIFRLELRINERKQTYVSSGYYMVMMNKWQNVECKCLKKAGECK